MASRLAPLARGTTRFGLPRGRPARERRPNRVVRKGGLEPPRYCYRQTLKLVRLPIPPLPRGGPAPINGCPTNVITSPALSVLEPASSVPVPPVQARLVHSSAAPPVRVRRAPSWDHADRQCRDTTRR